MPPITIDDSNSPGGMAGNGSNSPGGMTGGGLGSFSLKARTPEGGDPSNDSNSFNTAQYNKAYDAFTQGLGGLGNASGDYANAINQNFGKGSGDYLQNNFNASRDIAAQEAGATASGAQQQAQQASATAGMSPAQAALMGANVSGQTYGQAYGQDLGNTMNQYNTATGMNLSSRGNAANMELGGLQNQVANANAKTSANAGIMGANAEQTKGNAEQQKANTGLFGTIAGGIGSLLGGLF